jgi:transposase-like protein
MGCIGCGSAAVSERSERTAQGYRRFRCRTCGKQFNEQSAGTLNRIQYRSDVIALVVLWRLRYKLAVRDLPEMFLIRGVVFSHEAVRDWETKLAPGLAESLRRRRRGKAGCTLRQTLVDVPSQYLNNRLEQDHRGVKGRYGLMRGFKSPRSAGEFCRTDDELRNFLRSHSRTNQQVSSDYLRFNLLRRTATVLRVLEVARKISCLIEPASADRTWHSSTPRVCRRRRFLRSLAPGAAMGYRSPSKMEQIKEAARAVTRVHFTGGAQCTGTR